MTQSVFLLDIMSSRWIYPVVPAIIFSVFISRVTGQEFGGGCLDSNGRWPDPNQCDAYVECKNGVRSQQLCPDGLVFSTESHHRSYPCVQPNEADCTGRAALQPAQPNGDCPHQFGLYRIGDANNCGQFLSCANGRGFVFDCPEGLAFNEENLRCDWPDLVSTCNAEAFLGFSCPPGSGSNYDATGGYTYHRSQTFCEKFFICINGRPRLFICGKDKAFDQDTNSCQPAENVTGCYLTGSNQNVQSAQYNSLSSNIGKNYYK